MLDRLKSFPLTIVLTILIWMYAEAQFTATGTVENVPLRVVSDSPDFVVRVFDPEPGAMRFTSSLNVQLTLQGPRNQIEAIREELDLSRDRPGASQATLQFALGNSDLLNALMGNRQVERGVAEALNRLAYFREKGVTVSAAVPSRMRLDVDRVERLECKVVFRSTVAVDRARVEPESVEVLIPSQVLAAMDQSRITVLAVPANEAQLAGLPPETDQQVPVRFEVNYPMARDERIRTVLREGTATVHIPRRQQSSYALSDVPVWVSGPPSLLGRYDVEVQPRTVSVTLSGSIAQIEALRTRLELPGAQPRDAGVFAYLVLNPEDRPDPQTPSPGPVRRALRWEIPQGLTLNRSTGDVTFRLIEKPPPPVLGLR